MAVATLSSDPCQAFEALLATPPDQLAKYDIAYMNLLCAHGLPGAEDLNITECLATLDQWAEYIRIETERIFPRYQANPDPHKGSEAFYRLYMVIRVLRDTFGVHHDASPDKQTARVGRPVSGGGKFDDSAITLIHGLLGSRRVGSCSSLPVLYAAVGRRLGYPVKLALAVQHVFCRWDDGKEVFNLEGTGAHYINKHPDEYYIDSPKRWSDYERYSGHLLRSLTPAEELGVFCSMRAGCFEENGDLKQARDSYTHAARFSPGSPIYSARLQMMLDQLHAKRIPTGQPRRNNARMPHFNYVHHAPLHFAPAASHAAIIASHARWNAFQGYSIKARLEYQKACALDPSNTQYPKLMARVEELNYMKLPPSAAIRAADGSAKQGEVLITEKRISEAIVAFAKASRLHPKCWAYRERAIELVLSEHNVELKNEGVIYSSPHLSDDQLADRLSSIGKVLESSNNMMGSRIAYEEAAHLVPHNLLYSAQIDNIIQSLHQATQRK